MLARILDFIISVAAVIAVVVVFYRAGRFLVKQLDFLTTFFALMMLVIGIAFASVTIQLELLPVNPRDYDPSGLIGFLGNIGIQPGSIADFVQRHSVPVITNTVPISLFVTTP